MADLVTIRNAQCRIASQLLLVVEHFAIEQGQRWCVFGPNGSGKSLLANLLAGKRLESSSYVSYGPQFDPARDLHIVSFEEQQRLWERDNRLDISEYSSDAQDAGTVVECLIRASRNSIDQDETLLAEIVERLGLNALLSKGIRFLSSGQTRKALIARALYAYREGAPQLLVLDDPLESIDLASREQIRNTLAEHGDQELTSVQLCRRRQDILPGISHMALMLRNENLFQICAQGSFAGLEESAVFAAMNCPTVELSPLFDELLPQNSFVRDPEEELIRLENVNASYGDIQVLDNLTWTMKGGEHVVIEGPNGCGKSTLLSLIDGENHKGYGQQVYLFGRLKGSGETIWETKKHFGLVSNELHNKYIKGWRVIDVVISGFFDSVGLYDDSGSTEAIESNKWLNAFGLQRERGHYYHELSFGQQRLILLARAMVKKPRILILDEPCVGLDDYHRRLILAAVNMIAERMLSNILYVTHVADEQPDCINRRLRFEANAGGGFDARQFEI